MNQKRDREQEWQDLFEKQRATLEEAASMVLYRQDDPKEIVCAVMDKLKSRPFHEVFGPISALREVIKAAIARNCDSVEQDLEPQTSIVSLELLSSPLPLKALPYAERAVYFLHRVQNYARRDTALLLGLSDWEVDQLTTSAMRRMGHPEDESVRASYLQIPQAVSIRVRHSIAFALYE